MRQYGLYTPLLGITFAGFLSAVLSTADELLNCAALTLVFDVMGVSRDIGEVPTAKQRRIVASGQFYTSVFSVLAAALAVVALWYEKPISDLALAVFSGQVVFAVPLFVSFLWPNWARQIAPAAVVAMGASFVSAVAAVGTSWVIEDHQYADGAPIASFAVSIAVFTLFGLCRFGSLVWGLLLRLLSRTITRVRRKSR